MVTVRQRKALLEGQEDFARAIIEQLSEDSRTDSDLMSLARNHYDRDVHAEVLGRKKIQELEQNNLITNLGEKYISTTAGEEAYKDVFNDELYSGEGAEEQKHLLTGGSFRRKISD